MNDFSPKKTFSLRDAGERLVRAWVLDEEGEAFRLFSFAITAIDGVMELGEKRSALVLRSGMKIPVALSHEELEQKIYTHDFREPVLDLRNLTGAVAGRLEIKISALLRKSGGKEYAVCDFTEKEILAVEVSEKGMFSKTGKAVTFKFNQTAGKPYGDAGHILDMPYVDYKALLAAAKNEGLGTLDLCRVFREHPEKYGYK